MAKCVGITTDITADKWDLERRYPTMFNWKIVASDLTHNKAQKIKLEYKEKGYETTKDGEFVKEPAYSVFTFEY